MDPPPPPPPRPNVEVAPMGPVVVLTFWVPVRSAAEEEEEATTTAAAAPAHRYVLRAWHVDQDEFTARYREYEYRCADHDGPLYSRVFARLPTGRRLFFEVVPIDVHGRPGECGRCEITLPDRRRAAKPPRRPRHTDR